MKKNYILSMSALLMVTTMAFTACKSTDSTEKVSSETTMVETVKESMTKSTTKESKMLEESATVESSSAESVAVESSTAEQGPGINIDPAKANTKETPADKAPDPNIAPMTIISVYVPVMDSDKGLTKEMDGVENFDAQNIVDKCVEYGVLAKDAKVIRYDDVDGVATLELTGLDYSNRRSMVAIANTFIENFDLLELNILVGEDKSETFTFNNDYESVK